MCRNKNSNLKQPIISIETKSTFSDYNIKILEQFILENDKKRAFSSFILYTNNGLLDAAGVISILPFIAVLSNEALIETNFILNSVYTNINNLHPITQREYLVILGLFVFLLLGVISFIQVIHNL